MGAGDYILKAPQMKQVAHLYSCGYSMAQIADYFGVSKNAIKNALTYEGVQPREKFEARKLRDKQRALVTA